ncbi:class Ib ribonucleoside-diphosphate reductase assembly flavoprotein NrdI [Ligilactobacillus ceti]|uniref:Ribonucleotide reductase stimulatory protein n=1 Tax=Ligilactobacillus ceti DSM 22408 TaxID=1122146 RepID=A0A0R2KGG1_9LACO|nr:class Ib ribonucleoside-diphosphate reductase assembly flavoprotein NrdI [Ligilactobacillus ceti]KRN88472.1 ribonucleotide reductase stimulatory protein [Ligilactobacillus ceti DSM 22408]
MKIVYFSVTGQTRRFIKKLTTTNVHEIDAVDPDYQVGEPFILVVPTYEAAITAPVNDFLEYANNLQYFKGVVGTGNRNFAELFIFTAKDIARDYQVPLLYAFEFSGTDQDVLNFQKVVNDIESA